MTTIFDKKAQQRIKKIWDNNENVIIEGYTCAGVPFETTGRIATDKSGNCDIDDNFICLEWGKNEQIGATKESSYERGAITSIFFFDFQPEKLFRLYISKIVSENGEVIFDSTNAEKTRMDATVNYALRTKMLDMEKRLIKNYSSKEMLGVCNLIGKPIMVERENKIDSLGTITAFDRIDNYGLPIIDLCIGGFNSNCNLRNGDKVYEILPDGKRKFVCTFSMSEAERKENVKKINRGPRII